MAMGIPIPMHTSTLNWGVHRLLINAEQNCLRFHIYCSFRDYGDSKAIGVENRKQIRSFFFILTLVELGKG